MMSIDPSVIDENTQTFQGRVYRRRSDSGYFQCGGVPLLLHREVWRANTGTLQGGRKHGVHHIDEDKANNAFANLQMMSSKEHAQLHLTPERRAAMRANMIEKVVPAARAWHSSPEGVVWHKHHAREIAAAMKDRPLRMYACEHCHHEAASRDPRARFCDNNCRGAATRARRSAGIPANPVRNGMANIEPKPKTCIDCGGGYFTKGARALRCPPCRIVATKARARAVYAAAP